MTDAGSLLLETFSESEYRRRHQSLLGAATEVSGCDALLISAPQHLVYVAGDPTGFQRTGIHLGLAAVLLTWDDSCWILRRYEADSAGLASPIRRVSPYMGDVDGPVAAIARELRGVGVSNGTLGVALDRWGFTSADERELRALLPELTVRDVSSQIDDVTAVKSQEELDVMARAMTLTELGVAAFYAEAEPGRTESEVAAAILSAMTAPGSEPPFYHPFVLSGKRTAMPHGVWSLRKIERDEPVFLEVSAALRHYHAPLVRTLITGHHAEAERVHDVAQEALEAAIAQMRPGVLTGEVDLAARSVVARAGLAEGFRHRTGYAVGIDWVGRGAVSLAPEGKVPLKAGMVFHMPLNLFVPDRFGVGCSQTVAVTEDGSLRLSGLPLDLQVRSA